MSSPRRSDSEGSESSPESDFEIDDHEEGNEEGILPYRYEPMASDSDGEDGAAAGDQRLADAEGRLGNNHW